ncbi:MAG: UvrABC system protein C [Anaerolineaceae bacterium]|nr:excinuclease ABC subunit UvrC [Chloroflexota bacterium]NOG75715.1 excinuclease ABC subunit UvrC [Chloroflexota bacterium]WKZ56008.1 MAG: excinuclease ABC subunit UvrC [Anaerolineales bacterium]GIK10001.1 MAG: UvrABC system protein C [Chloroflexota bacterium]GJQ37651.1 MAG: UvrABC system protein C [Anaerolineaceae bacterium]
MEISKHIEGILATLPAKPGCYLMKNAEGTIIYVGKAINLKNRVRSYFHADSSHDSKTRRLVRQIADIEWIVVGSELEALILEMNLIKRHRPKYNIKLKDDKRYPYIKIHWSDPFPKVTVTRHMTEDGSRYFGPYTSAWAVYQTLDVLRRVFPYLTCDRVITGQDQRACLYYDIKLCLAPCIGAVNQAQYRQMISDLMDFLSGHSEPVLARVQAEMDKAAEELRFEKAAALRDQIKAMQNIMERQKVIFASDYKDSDVIALARADGEACVQIFFIRAGKLIGREYFILEGTEDAADAEVMEQFVKQFYTEAASVPQQVLLPHEIEEAKIIGEWMRSRRGGEKVEIRVPKEGQTRELVQMAAENASETLSALRTQWQADSHKQEQALAELQSALNLPAPPNRIECYDVSHTQGVATVGAMIVFEQGVPAKGQYRKFNIDSTSIGAPDDFASMEEMLTRRFRRWQSAEEAASGPGSKVDASFSRLPDLVIVDGGKGQLGRVVKVLENFELAEKVPVVGLAKQEEEIFFPHRSNSLKLPRHSQGLYLVQRIRDEAHRFGITAHRARRSKQGMASALDSVPGVGPARRKALLKHFGSVDKIRSATMEELASVQGINADVAESIKASLE